jgi:MFS family permease
MFAISLARWLAGHRIHYGWVMVALTFVTTICSSAAISLPGVLILPISQEFGWGRGDISGAIALMFVVFGGMAPFAGALMQRCGLSRVVTAAVLLAVVSLLGVTQTSAKWHLWLTIGVSLGTAAGTTGMTLAAMIANRWFSKRRGLVMGILAAAFAIGQLTFLPVAAWLASTHGWRMAVLPAAIGCAACAILYPLLARDWPAEVGLAPYGETRLRPPPNVSAGNVVVLSVAVLREAASTGWFWLLIGTFFVCGASSTGIVQQHFIPFCADNGLMPVRAASYLAVMGMFNFIGTVLSGWLSDRFDNRKLLACYYGLRGLSLVWLPFSGFDIVSLSIFAVFFGLDFIATVPPTVSLAAQNFGPEKAPIIFGWAFASHQFGAAASALGTGVTRDLLTTYVPAFLVAGLLCVLAAAAMLVVRPIRPEPLAAE